MRKQVILAFALLSLAALPTYAQKTTTMEYNRERVYTTETKVRKVWYQGELTAGFGYSGTLHAKVNVEGGESASWKCKDVSLQPSVTTVQGIRITQYFFLGVGATFNPAVKNSRGDADIEDGKFRYDGDNELSYDDHTIYNDENNILLPIFLNLKGYYPVTDRFSVYVTVSGGWTVQLNDNNFTYYRTDGSTRHGSVVPGYFGEYGFGLNYRKFNFSLGLQQQQMSSSIGWDSFRAKKNGSYVDYDAYHINSKFNYLSFFFKIGVKW